MALTISNSKPKQRQRLREPDAQPGSQAGRAFGAPLTFTLVASDGSNGQPGILIPKVGMYKGLPYMVLCKALHVPVYNASVNTHGR